MRWGYIARAWLVEYWLNLKEEPWRVIPHRHATYWWAEGGEYVCDTCGSSSERVQVRGVQEETRERRRREQLRRQLS